MQTMVNTLFPVTNVDKNWLECDQITAEQPAQQKPCKA